MPAFRSLGVALAGGLVFTASLVAGTADSESAAPDAPSIEVHSFQLDNGMEFLLVERPSAAVVAAGWAAHVGSVNERPGTTGLSHVLEHMMFKGTRTMGAQDPDAERALLEEQSRLENKLAKAYRKAGDAPETSGAIRELETRLAALDREGTRLGRQGELDLVYATNGATGVTAFTIQDMTVYLASLPAEKLELWFWLESDRLIEPVFRGFFNEKGVIRQERGLRIESTPTGRLENELRAAFWGQHPYAWPTMGLEEDLNLLRRTDAEEFFDRYYGPSNLTAVLVGNLDVAATRSLAERYFGRLASRPQPPAVEARAARLTAERRLAGTCDCRPQIQILYPGVPFARPDSYALSVLAGVMNGRTGRLYRSLVLEREIAFAAYTRVHAMRWEGFFAVMAEAKEGAGPEDLLGAWDEELARLVREGVPSAELRKVQNQIRADAFRRLREPDELRTQLLLYSGLGDWSSLNAGPVRVAHVTAEDVVRVARDYLRPEHRAVGLFRPATGGEETGSP